MAPNLQRFILIKNNIPDRAMESSEILQEFTKKYLLKDTAQKKVLNYEVDMVNFLFSCVYIFLTKILIFLMCFSVAKFHYNKCNYRLYQRQM
jgi:hypothetical protein